MPADPPDAPPPTGADSPLALPPRSEAFRRFMAAPLFFALALMLATGLLAVLAWRGGAAVGERVDLVFEGCPEARPLLLARAEAIGLGEPLLDTDGDRSTLRVTLPGLEDDRVAVPALLLRPGRLRLLAQGAPLAQDSDLTVAQVRLDESGMAYTWIELEAEALTRITEAVAADPEGFIDIEMDGEIVARRPNFREVADGGIRIIDEGEQPARDRMRRAVDRAILLTDGPLPCVPRLADLRPVAGGQTPR